MSDAAEGKAAEAAWTAQLAARPDPNHPGYFWATPIGGGR